jgi:hypothetical protein
VFALVALASLAIAAFVFDFGRLNKTIESSTQSTKTAEDERKPATQGFKISDTQPSGFKDEVAFNSPADGTQPKAVAGEAWPNLVDGRAMNSPSP